MRGYWSLIHNRKCVYLNGQVLVLVGCFTLFNGNRHGNVLLNIYIYCRSGSLVLIFWREHICMKNIFYVRNAIFPNSIDFEVRVSGCDIG